MPKKSNPEKKMAKEILVVEDEGEMRLVLDMVLNEKKVQLDYVSTLLAADEYLQKHTPSIVILDNKLPDGYGVDFISCIKRKYPSIKIIMITGFDASARDVALENGADFFLEKPFTKGQLVEEIKVLLSEVSQ